MKIKPRENKPIHSSYLGNGVSGSDVGLSRPVLAGLGLEPQILGLDLGLECPGLGSRTSRQPRPVETIWKFCPVERPICPFKL